MILKVHNLNFNSYHSHMCMHYKQHMQFTEIQKHHTLQNLFTNVQKMLKQMSHEIEITVSFKFL